MTTAGYSTPWMSTVTVVLTNTSSLAPSSLGSILYVLAAVRLSTRTTVLTHRKPLSPYVAGTRALRGVPQPVPQRRW